MLRIDRGIDGAEPIAREILGPVLPALDDAALGDEALADDRFVAWRTVLLRTAAASMLLDTPDAAPYGWTHCLTMPLAVLQLADRIGRRRALAVAATHVLGFRCGLAEATVGPGDFAGWVRPVAEDRFAGEAAALALTATRRHDAHLVKYSLAVLEAARLDPAAARLYLEAGRALVAWWDERGETSLDT